MTELVVDASVAVKWLVEEAGSDAALDLQGRALAAPALLRLEVGNTLRTLAARGALDDDTAVSLYTLLQRAPMTIVDPDAALEAQALRLALDLGQPIYDCVYLALAQRLDCAVVTADRRFARTLVGHALAKRVQLLSAD